MFKRKTRRKLENPKTTPVSFALTEAETEKLYSYCYERGISVSSYVREVVLKSLGE